MTLPALAVLAASLVAAFCDVRTRRIPNAIAIALLLCGLALSAQHGWQSAALDLAITFAILFAGSVAFSLRLIGGGDVKLLAAAAGVLGYPQCVGFILMTLVCGGVLAVVFAAARGRLGATLANVQSMTMPVFAGVRPVRPQNSIAMPYALAIFAGAAITAFLPHLRLFQ